MVIVYQAVSIPYFICFSVDETVTSLYTVDFIFMIYFMLDICLCFNTAFYENGDLIENRKDIIKNYLKL